MLTLNLALIDVEQEKVITSRQGRVLHVTRLGFTELAQSKPQNRLSEHVHRLVAWFWKRHGSIRCQTGGVGGLLYSTVITAVRPAPTLTMVSVVLLSRSRQLPA
jgi:hypothetical protein